MTEPFEAENIRGFLHWPAESTGVALALSHGAGSNCQAPLLRAMADSLANSGILVLRFDLPFRMLRRTGPPLPAMAAADRDGIRSAAGALRQMAPGLVFLGGHSYGGRQAAMLAAEEASAADGLLLLSYPLHPPRKPEQMRTGHFPDLRTPALFVHGTRDPFGSPEEIRTALRLIPARTDLMLLEHAGHNLRTPADAPARITARFQAFFESGRVTRP